MTKKLVLKRPDMLFRWDKDRVWKVDPKYGFMSFYLGKLTIDCWFWKTNAKETK
jgi:hypothetical protein